MQDQYQPLINDLEQYTVAIKDRETGETHGTGVIVTDDGLILTCYHVIGDNESKTLYYKDAIDIYFPSANITKPATIEEEYSNPELDVAFLKLNEEKVPAQTAIAILSESIQYGHKFASIGFRKAQRFKKLDASGEIRIETGIQNEEGDSKEFPSIIKLYSDEIEEGMSGAAVLDLDLGKVVGIISLHYRNRNSTNKVDENLNFAIPISSILEVDNARDILKAKNPGLKMILQFVREIGSDSIWYKKIEDLYVAPKEYQEIESTLEDQRIVFITGSKEYGKTYTAIKLLWEYYRKGYKPKFILEEQAEKLSHIINSLLGDEKLKHHVIYFEVSKFQSEKQTINIMRNFRGIYLVYQQVF
jgi:Trypsin-like peptidase domain